jgi:hypothetical protein
MSTASAPVGQMQPVPNGAISTQVVIATTGTYAAKPPLPLPQTLMGLTNYSSSST